MNLEIYEHDYCVQYHPNTTTITCQGVFQLRGDEGYAAVTQLLQQVAASQPPCITLDLRRLRFLNSSGINMLAKFVIQMRQQKSSQMRVIGTQAIPWQEKSLRNFQRLMPSLQLIVE